jgi:hypothetical protein
MRTLIQEKLQGGGKTETKLDGGRIAIDNSKFDA